MLNFIQINFALVKKILPPVVLTASGFLVFGVLTMKKFLGVIFALLIFTNSAAAMSFNSPMKFGEISFTMSDGTTIKGADNNFGEKYGSGVATFGHDLTEIKCFYNYDTPPKFGSDFSNYQINLMLNTSIDAIFTDENLILYMFTNTGYDLESTNFVLLGKKLDGTFIKYFDSAEENENYTRPIGAYLDKNYLCDFDTINFFWKRNGETVGRLILQWHAGKLDFMIKEIIY